MNWSILNTLKFGRTFERIDLRYSLNTFIIWKSYEKGVSLSKYDNYHREFSMCISRHKWLLQRQNKEWEVTLRRRIPVVNQDQHAQSIAQYMCSIVCSEQMKLTETLNCDQHYMKCGGTSGLYFEEFLRYLLIFYYFCVSLCYCVGKYSMACVCILEDICVDIFLYTGIIPVYKFQD